MKKAFTVRASVGQKSWMTKSTTLTADLAEQAIERAKLILNLTNEHEVKVEEVTVYPIGHVLTSDNYPYGRLRTTATYTVEMNKKGCRTIFQTVDPKNGRLNKPKHSTYCDGVILPCVNSLGHFDDCGWINFNGAEQINKGLHFVSDFFELFTPAQIEDIALRVVAMTKIDAKARVIYSGSVWEDIKPYYENAIKVLCDIAKTKTNRFSECLLDVAGLDSKKDENYNPFQVKKVEVS